MNRKNVAPKFAILVAAAMAAASSVLAQEQPMPGMQMPPAQNETHHHNAMQTGVLPRFGKAQKEAREKLFKLEQAQETARMKNPTLRQAEAGIRAAKARQMQAGLLPNPIAGYSGDEIRGGEAGGGKQGFLIEQRIVTGGKLWKSRGRFSKETSPPEMQSREQKRTLVTRGEHAFYCPS